MALRVLLLTQWFEPEPTFKGLAFARALQAHGYDVSVLTGFPNYPGGKLYPGYRIKLLQREWMDGISVTRVPLYPSHDQSAIRRIANYLSFAASSLFYGLFCCRRFDVIYAYHPPLTVGLVAVLLKVFRRSRVVIDIQDLWPDTLRATGMINNQCALSLIGKVASLTYRMSDAVVVLSEGFRKRLLNRGVPEKKLEVIRNWADDQKLNAETKAVQLTQDAQQFFNILFAGNMGSAQALDSVLDAAEILEKQSSRVRFVLMGKGLDVKRLKEDAQRRKLANVMFLPAVPMEEVGGYLQAADALLVHLRDDELFEITIPSKTQAYMAVGKPILIAVRGDAEELINQAGCGVVAEPQNAVSIAIAAEQLATLDASQLASMGRQGREFYERELSLTSGAEKFSKVFERVLQKS